MALTERKTVYLANPYGFSRQQRALLLPQIVDALEALGLEVWEPFQRNNQVDLFGDGMGVPRGRSRLQGRAGGGRHLRRGERRAAGRGGHGGAWDGHRPGQADVPVPGRLPTRHRQRGVSLST